MSQEELAARLVAAGLSGRTAGALERGDLEMRPVHRAALCEALGVAEAWFLAPLDKILGHDLVDDPAAAIEQQLAEILQKLTAISRKLGI